MSSMRSFRRAFSVVVAAGLLFTVNTPNMCLFPGMSGWLSGLPSLS